MGNNLDELKDETSLEGRDIKVINKQIPVTVGSESVMFQLGIWLIPIIIVIIIGVFVCVEEGFKNGITYAAVYFVIGLIPGTIFYFKKVKADNYLMQLEQKLQHDSSQIDNYQEQRVIILQNVAKLLEKGTNLDKEVFTKIAALRSGKSGNDSDRNQLATDIDSISNGLNVAFENYPELKSHNEIEDAMQQNSYLQREITAAREVYNDSVLTWNREIFVWPINKIVAAKKGYTTRIPFIASQDTKQKSKDVFF